MAYTIDLSVSIASDRESFELQDLTEYGTSGNPARADVRVFASAAKVNYSNEETDVPVESNDGDPQTDSYWTGAYDLSSDGYWKFRFVIIKEEYDALETYDIYDAVYDGSNSVYRSKQNSNTGNALNDTAFWEVITDVPSLADNFEQPNESVNIESLVYLRVLRANSQWKYADIISDNCGCTDCDEGEIIQNYQIASLWLNGMAVADSREEVLKGELIARRFESRFLADC